MKFWTILYVLMMCSSVAFGACPVGDEFARKQGLSDSMPIYIRCALDRNDEDSQLKLARLYRTGQSGIPQNTKRALLFYHLAADNGNATAMVELSTLLTHLDEADASRIELQSYLRQIQSSLTGSVRTTFRGGLLHPYALLVLAAESPGEKWFYPSATKSDARASSFLSAYRIDPDKKSQAIHEATAWKQRKLMERAAEVLPPRAFKTFYQTLYPEQGRVDPLQRSRAVNALKEKIESRNK